MKDVKSDKVTAVTIKQNKEVPTGTITAEFGKDDYKSCEVTDVNQAINDIKKAEQALLPIRSVLRESITVGI